MKKYHYKCICNWNKKTTEKELVLPVKKNY